MLLLQCPKCGNRMKYQNRDPYLSDKSKKCVYCNKTFKILGNVVRKDNGGSK